MRMRAVRGLCRGTLRCDHPPHGLYIFFRLFCVSILYDIYVFTTGGCLTTVGVATIRLQTRICRVQAQAAKPRMTPCLHCGQVTSPSLVSTTIVRTAWESSRSLTLSSERAQLRMHRLQCTLELRPRLPPLRSPLLWLFPSAAALGLGQPLLWRRPLLLAPPLVLSLHPPLLSPRHDRRCLGDDGRGRRCVCRRPHRRRGARRA